LSIRNTVKSILPKWVRTVLRACLHYAQRLARWPIILWQMRGMSWSDQWVLLQSAAAAPFVSVRKLMEWQDPVLIAPCTVEVQGYGVFKLRPHCDDLWHVLPWREQSISNLLKCTLRPGDTFIDAGANIGVYTVLASRLVGPEGKVISIEMMPDTADRLEANIRDNRLGNVWVVRKALSDRSGQTVMATVQSEKYGQATIATDSARYGKGKKVAVETVTLDAVAEGIKAVQLMKIDLEGAELAALCEAFDLFPRLSNVVYESWGWKRSHSNPVDDLLRKKGFVLRQLDGNNWLAARGT
jgi:FkbM family methyltransferase